MISELNQGEGIEELGFSGSELAGIKVQISLLPSGLHPLTVTFRCSKVELRRRLVLQRAQNQTRLLDGALSTAIAYCKDKPQSTKDYLQKP